MATEFDVKSFLAVMREGEIPQVEVPSAVLAPVRKVAKKLSAVKHGREAVRQAKLEIGTIAACIEDTRNELYELEIERVKARAMLLTAIRVSAGVQKVMHELEQAGVTQLLMKAAVDKIAIPMIRMLDEEYAPVIEGVEVKIRSLEEQIPIANATVIAVEEDLAKAIAEAKKLK